ITTTTIPKEKSTTDMGLSTLKPVLEVIKKINTELNLRKLITMILDTAIEFCNAQRGTIVVFEGEKFKIELSSDRQQHERKRLDSEVARARRHGRPCGVLMMDVDDFKKINDTYGHDAGNEILKRVARVLAATMRTDDLVARRGEERDTAPVVARYGGDEFEI